MQELHLTLTVDEINKILGALSKQVYADVYEVVAKITKQAQDQLQSKSTENNE